MMRKLFRTTAALALAAGGMLAAGPAQAANSNSDFGQHVRHCAQTMGFDGTHNPGMHQGKSGWEPGHMCPMH
jgi:hypothetical protein